MAAVNKDTITRGLRYSIATGNWGMQGTAGTRAGVSQVRQHLHTTLQERHFSSSPQSWKCLSTHGCQRAFKLFSCAACAVCCLCCRGRWL
jgi:hypothetical protein